MNVRQEDLEIARRLDLLDEMLRQLDTCETAPRLVLLLAKPYEGDAEVVAVCSRRHKSTLAIMEDSLRRRLLGPTGKQLHGDAGQASLAGNSIQMGNIVWWQRVIRAGVLPANRVPLLPTGNPAVDIVVKQAILTRWKPRIIELAKAACICLFIGSTHLEGYEELLAESHVLRVPQPVYQREAWSWPLQAAILWKEALLDVSAGDASCSSAQAAQSRR